MKSIAFITGITGQDGSYLSELLLEKNYEVHGMKRRNSTTMSTKNIDHIRSQLQLHYGDITDVASITSILSKLKGKVSSENKLEIYHLAAQSHVWVSFQMPLYTGNCDAIGTLNLLTAIESLGMTPMVKLYNAASSEMFGRVLEVPQNETTPFNPISPYAAAKLYSYYMVKNYREAYGMFACSGILFNHESPRRGESFVTRKIVIEACRIKQGREAPLVLGNLDSKRDWSHAKDMVRAMWMILQEKEAKDYVAGSGKQYSVRYFVERVFEKLAMKITWEASGENEIGKDNNGRIVVKVSPYYYRPTDVVNLLSDPSLIEKELGWKTEINLEEMIDEMIYNELNTKINEKSGV